MPRLKKNAGLTLIELLIVIAILILLFLIAFLSWRNQMNKAQDADKKDDLQKIRIAFEEYYSDNECYPIVTILDTCDGNQLNPYLDKIPCDPVTSQPYCYVPDGNPCPQNFRILAPLENTSDPIITDLQCHGESYCGYEAECATTTTTGFNYGVTSTNIPLLNPTVSPPPIPSSPPSGPSPSPPSGVFACDPNGVCNFYDDSSTCGATFATAPPCQAYCPTSPPSERCDY
ncbi:prepilin-type N-terminal cleavage/methylation domain-containing protein [Patescibacteria group bacterium]